MGLTDMPFIIANDEEFQNGKFWEKGSLVDSGAYKPFSLSASPIYRIRPPNAISQPLLAHFEVFNCGDGESERDSKTQRYRILLLSINISRVLWYSFSSTDLGFYIEERKFDVNS